MRPLLVIHHLEPPAMGRAAAILDAAGLTFDERLISAGEPLPALDEVAGILSPGGHESVAELPPLRVPAGRGAATARGRRGRRAGARGVPRRAASGPRARRQ